MIRNRLDPLEVRKAYLRTHADEINVMRRKVWGDAPIGYAFVPADVVEQKLAPFIVIADPDEVAWVKETWDPTSPVSGPGPGKVCVLACLQ